MDGYCHTGPLLYSQSLHVNRAVALGFFLPVACSSLPLPYINTAKHGSRSRQSSEFRHQAEQAEERNPLPFSKQAQEEERNSLGFLITVLFRGMAACGGGARMTAAAAAAAATKMMAAPWLLACSLLLCLATFQGAEGAIGVNYGMVANNLPAPEQVVSMYKAKNISYVRLFHPDTSVLNALRGSGIGVVLGTLNEDLPRLASDPSFAASWVATNVQPFAGAVQFRYINAGNEVIPGDAAAQVLPAMKNLESALQSAGVTGVPVTTAVATSVLGASYPPSQGAFSEAAAPVMAPIVSYLSSRGAPLLVNVYPYFAYSGSGGQVALGYALLSADGAGAASSVADGGVMYTNMFDAIVDATHAAVEKAGVQGLELVVSETGWPSGGGGAGATVENAAAYNNNVVRHVGGGTPRRPGKAVETYLFAMFNENGKAEGVEQHFGLFQPDMSEVYHVDFTAGST